MKKILTFAVAALALAMAFSSCKKEEAQLSDAELVNKIASYQSYAGTYKSGADSDIAALGITKSAASGAMEFAIVLSMDITDPEHPSDDDAIAMGNWEVVNGELILHGTKSYGEPRVSTIKGAIEKNGEKFTLTSGSATFEFERVKLK
ncbi:MAG: hypothetical protein MJ007_00305 [Paludibacteraceae bacterium]|nr:hypothetical protein [Paludibacteraceae bacterium]